MAAVHYAHEDCADTVCGMPVESAAWKNGALRTTRDAAKTTCRNCTRRILDGEPVEYAEEPEYVAPPAAKAQLGQRLLSEAAKRFARGETRPEYAWRSAEQAIRAWYETPRTSVPSTSAPARFEQAPRGEVDITVKVTGAVDRLHGVDRAMAGAYPSAVAMGELVLTVHQQHHILRGLVVGWDAARTKPMSRASVAESVSESWGFAVTERQVAIVRRAGIERVAERLRAIGELAPAEPTQKRDVVKSGDDEVSEEEKEAGRMSGFDLAGWKAIAEYVAKHLGTPVSESAVRRLAREAVDPFPTYKIAGMWTVFARSSELSEWLKRNERRSGVAAPTEGGGT